MSQFSHCKCWNRYERFGCWHEYRDYHKEEETFFLVSCDHAITRKDHVLSHDGETEPEALLSVRHESLSFSLSLLLTKSLNQAISKGLEKSKTKKSCAVHRTDK